MTYCHIHNLVCREEQEVLDELSYLSTFMKPVHLPGLNGLRAIVVLAVLLERTTHALRNFGLKPLHFGPFMDIRNGWDIEGYGISIFFALSGFLVTYLLLLEKKQANVNVRNFYIRRMLRIWPLYYLYLFICVGLMLFIGVPVKTSSLLYYIFVAANVPFILKQTLPFVSHYWPLAVVQQFSFFWPWVVKKAGKYLPAVTLTGLVLLIALKVVLRFVLQGQYLWYKTLNVTNFPSMLLGVLGALLYYQKSRVLKPLTSKAAQALGWSVILMILLNCFPTISIFNGEIVSAVAIVLILGQITVKNRLINLETKWLDFFGVLSYGIYVIHPLVIFGLPALLGPVQINATIKYVVVYASVIGCTTLLAYLSFHFFEKRFLKLKNRYTVIQTQVSLTD